VLPQNAALPTQVTVPATLPAGQPKGFVRVLAGSVEAADAHTALGEVAFEVEGGEGDIAATIVVAVAESGAINVQVVQTSTKLIVGTLDIPASA
jgi:hypothetical protein